MVNADLVHVGEVLEVSASDREQALDLLSRIITEKQIDKLEEAMLQLPQIDVPVTHHFQGGVYMREITLPAGTIAIGNRHVDDCLNIMLTGCVTLVNDGELKDMNAPAVFVSKAGIRKVGFIQEKSTWITVHSTTETDPAVLDESLIIKSKILEAHEKKKLELQQAKNLCLTDSIQITRRITTKEIEEDKQDFQGAIAELGYSEFDVWFQSNDTRDQTGDGDNHRICLAVSCRDENGLGIFAKEDIKGGEVIAPARINGLRAIGGRYTNHSKHPNAIMQANGKEINLVALCDIPATDEVTVDYRQARKTALSIDQSAAQPVLL